MAQKGRSKELWLIPKRVSLHQTICLIDGIQARGFDGSQWNEQKQNNLGVNLKKWGATEKGLNVSNQSIRTLVAAVPQYLGFLYINTSSTPSTINLTEAGKELLKTHKNQLKKIKNLRAGSQQLICTSEVALRQLEKLQITNPIIRKDCENILLFPFRMTLKLLSELDYLDMEEIALYLLKARDESETNYLITEVRNFRKLSNTERKKLVDTYKETHFGNITLVQAPSARYFESLCLISGLIEEKRIKPVNRNRSISSIKIVANRTQYVYDLLNVKYKDIQPYDFGDNLRLWIEYFGNCNRLTPPMDIKINNKIIKDVIVTVSKDGKFIDGDLVVTGTGYSVPMFLNETYHIEVINKDDGSLLLSHDFTPSSSLNYYDICGINVKSGGVNALGTIEEIAKELLELSDSRYFSKKIFNYLTIVGKITNNDRTADKSLRGAYYEYLFFQFLSHLQVIGVIDEVIWNGNKGKYGIPVQAPGGLLGTPDITFKINNQKFVLEVTTIRAKSLQFRAEGASVPDHLIQFKRKHGNVAGVFCAPVIHHGNTTVMQAAISSENISIKCLSDKELIAILMKRNRSKVFKELI